MKPRYFKLLSRASGIVLILLPGLGRVAFGDLNEEFRKQLLRIRSKGIEASTLKDYEALEAQALSLLEDHNTPTEKGMIYATICWAYSAAGYGRSDEGEAKLSKTIKYGKQAIEHPIPDVLVSCRVHGNLAGAMFVKARNGPQERFADARREAIAPCLKGLKIALDNKAPKERPKPPPPIFVPHSITPNKESRKKELAEYERQLAEWKEFRHFYALQVERHALAAQCITFYSQEPYDTQEFQEHAQKILVGHDEAINDLIVQIEKRIHEEEIRRARLEKLKPRNIK